MYLTLRVERLIIALEPATLAIANRYLDYLEGIQQKEIDALTTQVQEITARERDSAAKLQAAVNSTT